MFSCRSWAQCSWKDLNCRLSRFGSFMWVPKTLKWSKSLWEAPWPKTTKLPLKNRSIVKFGGGPVERGGGNPPPGSTPWNVPGCRARRGISPPSLDRHPLKLPVFCWKDPSAQAGQSRYISNQESKKEVRKMFGPSLHVVRSDLESSQTTHYNNRDVLKHIQEEQMVQPQRPFY